MVEAVRDRSLDWLCSVSSSSSAFERVLEGSANCSNIKGWDELVNLYSASVQAGEKAGSENDARKRRNSEKSEETNEKNGLTASQPTASFFKGNQITCPVCEYVISSNALRAGDIISRKFLRHLRKHEGELDNTMKIPCTSCYHFCKKSRMDDHFKQHHGEAAEDTGVRNVICFTNSTRRYQSMVDTISASLKSYHIYEDTCSRIPENSIFTGSTRMGLVKSRENCRQKFLSVSDRNALFRFKYRQTSNLPYAWLCPLCEESDATSRCSAFHNDISLRLFVLRHFAVEHHDLEGIPRIIQQEWAILSYEIGFDLEFHVVDTAILLRQSQRSGFFYTLRRLKPDHHDALVHEMVGRSMNKEEICSSDYCVCMVCFKPVLKKSLGRHLSTAGHEWLNAHNDHSEFREVPEITDVETITLENFPYAALYFSKVFRIKEVDDCESIIFLKWRCLLDSSVQGHASEVLEFPTKELLKVHVLKHLETYHQDFFNADFFQYERAVLQQELPNAADVYAYTPLSWSFDNEPFDTANPNHFDVPFRAKLLPRSCCDVQICGFCFWCGYSPQFLAHITCHGYVENGTELSDDPVTAFPVSLLTVDPESIDSEHFNIPNKILGKVGREVQRRLRGPYLALNNDGEIAKPLTIGDGGAGPRSPGSASNDLGAVEQHQTEIFVPRSECSSRPDSAMDISSTVFTDGAAVDAVGPTTKRKEDVPLFNNSFVVPKGEDQKKEAIVSILARTSTPDSVSQEDRCSSVSTISEEDVITPANTEENLDVQQHKLNIYRKFLWEGPPPPPLDTEQTAQLICLSRNECPFCTTASGARGLRVPQFANDEIREESMIAHIVKFHHSDPAATWVLVAKRFHMSSGKRLSPLKFLMEPTKDGCLMCSSCEKASFDRIANLRVHWNACVAACGRYRKDLRDGRMVLDTPSLMARTKRRRSKNEAIKCPLPNCVSAWRPSFKYPNAVTQIAHMISHHCADKEAYETAVKLGETERLAEEFPFLDVKKSFANSVISEEKLLSLQCAKCDRGFHSPYELVQHALRYHPTEQHYAGAPKCPFRCNKRLQRLKTTVSDNVLRLLHVMICHLPEPSAVEWVENWLRRHGESVMENEPLFRFDVRGSLDATIESGESQVLCSWCSTLIEGSKYYAHRRRGSGCYGRPGEVSEKAQDLIDKSKVRVARMKLLGKSAETPKSAGKPPRKHNFAACSLCTKNIIMSDKYSERVSTFLHVLHIHTSDHEAQNSLILGYSASCAVEFPYIDVKASVEGTATLGKPTLQCVICGFKTDTSRRIAMHARHHEDLMKDFGNYPQPCQCGEQIRNCGEVKESYQRLCHVIEKHISDETQLQEAVSSYEKEHAGESMILDTQKSLELCVSGTLTFACSGCDFSCSNSYALIHHSKIHETKTSNGEGTVKKENSRRTESPIVCTVCNRLLLRSSRYSVRVTILAHFVKFHRNSPKDVEKFLASGTWDVAGEFPYIDAVTSIKKGKLQCALCEAAFMDTCPLLKHATCVHESQQTKAARAAAKALAFELRSATMKEEPPSQHDSAPSSPPCEDQRDTTQLSRETTKPSGASHGDDNSSTRSSSRSSRRYAPANDRVPRLPSDDEDEAAAHEKSPTETNASQETTVSTNERLEEGEYHSAAQEQGRAMESGEGRAVSDSGSTVTCQNREPEQSGVSGANSERPLSTTPKQPTDTGSLHPSSSAAKLLSWLSLTRGAVVPPRQAELLPSAPESKPEYLIEQNLRDILQGNSTGDLFQKTPKQVSKDGRTLFDEIPQRVVKSIAKQGAPTDISHIEGAKGYPCNFCEFKGRTVNDIRRHTSSVHSEFFPSMSTKIVSPCHHCNEVLDSRGKLLKHIGDCHEDIPLAFRCAYCPKTFATARGVREHERRSHESRLFLDAEHLVCPHCEQEFQNKRNRDEHVKRHNNPNSMIGRGF